MKKLLFLLIIPAISFGQITKSQVNSVINEKTSKPAVRPVDLKSAMYKITDFANQADSISKLPEADPTVPSNVKSISSSNIANWNAAYGWGNPAGVFGALGGDNSYIGNNTFSRSVTAIAGSSGITVNHNISPISAPAAGYNGVNATATYNSPYYNSGGVVGIRATGQMTGAGKANQTQGILANAIYSGNDAATGGPNASLYAGRFSSSNTGTGYMGHVIGIKIDRQTNNGTVDLAAGLYVQDQTPGGTGTTNATAAIHIEGAGSGNSLSFSGIGGAGANAKIYSNSANQLQVDATSGVDLNGPFRSNSTSSLGGHVTPGINAGYNLGSPSLRWSAIYGNSFRSGGLTIPLAIGASSSSDISIYIHPNSRSVSVQPAGVAPVDRSMPFFVEGNMGASGTITVNDGVLSKATSGSWSFGGGNLSNIGNVTVNDGLLSKTTAGSWNFGTWPLSGITNIAASGSQTLGANMAVGQSIVVGTSASFAPSNVALEVRSTTKTFLPPVMTQTQRDAISSPVEGSLIFQSSGTKGWYGYIDGAWVKLN